MSKPRVLLIGDHFGYPGGIPHGVTSYYLTVVPAIIASGTPMALCFLRGPHPLAAGLEQAGIHPTFLDSRKWDPLVVWRLLRIIRRYRPDVIHAVGMKAGLLARAAARFSRAVVAVHVHDMDVPPLPLRILYRLLAHPSDVGLSVSRAVCAHARHDYSLPRARNLVLHNGLRLEPFQDPRLLQPDLRQKTLGLGADIPVIGMIGRFYPVKGHRLMLRAFQKVLIRVPTAVLVLVGDGPEADYCRDFVRSQNIGDQVRFLGQRSDIALLMHCFDLIAMPSESEGLPMVAIEAMASGRPVVAFHVGGLPDLVSEGETGYLVTPGDTDAFSRAIIELFEDPERRRQFSARSLERAGDFSLDRHVRRLEQIYATAVDRRFWHGVTDAWELGN